MVNFFYGEQANPFSFYRLPKALLVDPRFLDLGRVQDPVQPAAEPDEPFGKERLAGRYGPCAA